MDKNQTRQLSNEAVEAAIKEYAGNQTKENLTKVVNLLRPSLLLVPAMVNEEKKAVPLFLRNNEGIAFLAVFTGKEQVPDDMRKQTVMVMPFPMCNGIVANDNFTLKGMVLNPYTDNLILKTDLIKRLYEADQELAKQMKMRQQNISPAQYAEGLRRQVEYKLLPARLYTEGEDFVNRLCAEKEALICGIFGRASIAGRGNPYKESDFAVMALNISSELTLIRIDMPGKAEHAPFCYRVYLTFNPISKKAGYYTIEKFPDQEGRRLGAMDMNGKHVDMGEAPIEGVELQEIIERAEAAEKMQE